MQHFVARLKIEFQENNMILSEAITGQQNVCDHMEVSSTYSLTRYYVTKEPIYSSKSWIRIKQMKDLRQTKNYRACRQVSLTKKQDDVNGNYGEKLRIQKIIIQL